MEERRIITNTQRHITRITTAHITTHKTVGGGGGVGLMTFALINCLNDFWATSVYLGVIPVTERPWPTCPRNDRQTGQHRFQRHHHLGRTLHLPCTAIPPCLEANGARLRLKTGFLAYTMKNSTMRREGFGACRMEACHRAGRRAKQENSTYQKPTFKVTSWQNKSVRGRHLMKL